MAKHRNQSRDCVCRNYQANIGDHWAIPLRCLVSVFLIDSFYASGAPVSTPKCTIDTGKVLPYVDHMGRKPMGITRKSVSLHDLMWAEISEYRFAHRITTEAETIRRLLEIALEAERRKEARRG
jgi:hypothetical protein